MSLDVTLLIPGKDREDFNSYEMRHLAVNFAITCEKGYKGSFDSWFLNISPSWREIANQNNPDYEKPTEAVYDANITHNLGKMASEAGLYEALWRPYRLMSDYTPFEDYTAESNYESSVTIKANEIIDIVEKGLDLLKSKPEHFKTFDSPNGWGIYDHFVPFVEKYLEALKQFPESIISISR